MSHRVTIRPASSEDGDHVLPLARDMATSFVVDTGAFASSFAELLGRDDAVVLVALEAAAVVGYLLGFDHLAFYANGRVAYVEEVAVREDRRGAAIGRQLMRGIRHMGQVEIGHVDHRGHQAGGVLLPQSRL